MHLISKLKENANFRITTAIYNACIRAPLNLPPIGFTAIYNAIKRSNHKLVRTEKTTQQSDRNLVWKQARFNACSQFIVRFGMEYPEGNTSGAELSDPNIISVEKIKEDNLDLVIEQVAFWDEKHIEQVCGEHRDFTYQFGYDEEGKYSQQVEVEVTRKVSSLIYLLAT